MRPDRIILGEARGPEAVDMLQAMNTGHEGSLTTVHANDARDALSRLELMIGLAGLELPVSVMRGYIASAFSLIVHVSRLAGGARRVTRVAELRGLKDGTTYRVRDLFRFEQSGVVDGEAVGSFRATGYVPTKLLDRLSASGRPVDAGLFADRPLLEILPTVGAGGDEVVPDIELTREADDE
jgi:pilus assembly protein CpaF